MEHANTVMVPVVQSMSYSNGNPVFHGLRVVATRDIAKGDPLCYDYRIQGDIPKWYAQWVEEHGVVSAFPGTNDYVAPIRRNRK